MKLKNKADMLITKSRKLFFLHFTDIRTIDIDMTGIRFIKRTHNLQQSSFTSTTWSDNTHNFSFIYLQINTFKNL